jgi:hypothetical protein
MLPLKALRLSEKIIYSTGTQVTTSTVDHHNIISKIPTGITSAIRSMKLKDFEPILKEQLNKLKKSEALDIQ